MSRFLITDTGWRGGYRGAFFIQIGIALLLFLTLPLWKKVAGKDAQEEENIKVLSIRELAKIPGVVNMWVLFLTSCSIESTTNGWGSTFLVEFKGMAVDQAAKAMIFYFVGFTAGRLLSGILATKLSCWKIIRSGMYVLGLALVLLLLPLPNFFMFLALFFIGVGNSPMFPNFTYLAPENFGADISQSVIGTQIAAANTGFLVAPLLCSLLGQVLGMGVFPVYLAVIFIFMVLGILKFQRTMKAAGKDIR